MTLEITVGRSGTSYRVNPDNPKQLDSRENRHGARWQFCARYASPSQARAALLAIESIGPGRTEGDVQR